MIDLADVCEQSFTDHYDSTLPVTNVKPLNELHLRDIVAIQNQHENNPLRWNRTSIIEKKVLRNLPKIE